MRVSERFPRMSAAFRTFWGIRNPLPEDATHL